MRRRLFFPLFLETKGQDTQRDRTKREFLDEWIRAINGHGGFGRWKWAVSKNPADVREIIKDAAKGLMINATDNILK